METSKVYFTNLRTTPSSNLLDKMERLVKRAGIANIDFQNQFVAIKIHFGEPGNLAFIRPNYAARMATLLRNLGAKPFLTDCNTLYSGRRANAVDHLESAMENGFNPISAKCDVIIADGLKGTEYREIEIDGEYCKAPKIGSAIADMVIKAPIQETGNRLSDAPHHEHLEGCDKFHLMHPDTNWQAGLEHAEKIGLGTQKYELITV